MRTLTTFLSGWGIIFVSLFPVQAQDSEPVTLRYKFRVGETVSYDVSMEDRYDITIGESNDKPYSLQESRKSFRVKEVLEDGNAVLVLTPLEFVDAEVFQNGETIAFDSRVQKKAPELFASVGDLLARPSLEATVSPVGQLLHVENLLSGAQKPEEVSQTALDLLVRLPNDPVRPGEGWREEYEVDLKVADSMLSKPVRCQRRFTLQSVEGGRATIEMKTVVLTPLSDPTEQAQLIRRTPSGTVVFDISEGQLVSRDLSQDNQVTGFVRGPSAMTFKQHLTERRVDNRSAQETGGTLPQ